MDNMQNRLEKYLPPAEGEQKLLADAMRYSVLNGGKRIRPRLLLLAFEMFDGTGPDPEPFMAAIEMLHAYSLVHDDLPALDHDTQRRGQPSTWYRYGECMGILAGDGLLHQAFETVALALNGSAYPERVSRAFYVFAHKSGVSGMLGGQALDTLRSEMSVTERELLDMYGMKTAALLEASLMIGAILAGADEQIIGILEQVGRKTGLAFQIRDDILDDPSADENAGSDRKNEKPTYVSLFGRDAAQRKAEQLSCEAAALLNLIPADSDALAQMIREMADRSC